MMNQRKAVQILIIFLICLSSLLNTALEAKIITDSNTPDTRSLVKIFLNAFLKAKEANDKIRMEELVRQTRPFIVFYAVISQSKMGITSIAKGKDGNIHFAAGEAIAKILKELTGKRGLLELVRIYKSYTREMCKDKLRGDDLINEGNSLNQKAQWKAASKKFLEALNIFKEIDDPVGKSLSLEGIGYVYTKLDNYTEALDFFKLSLSINRKIGDVVGEAYSLNGIGNVYFILGKYSEALNSFKHRGTLPIH
jgi:tetratricopeptide (TPR) repeat protein